jgi:hypothetical protein
VQRSARDILLSYSPGGGNMVDDGRWVAGQRGAPEGGPGVLGETDGPLAAMYRIVTDFHGGWYGWGGLQESLFILGNFSSVQGGGLAGANNTHPDPDMLPMRADWWGRSQEQDDRGQTIATAWVASGAPLVHAGELPVDATTLRYLTNGMALRVHAAGANRSVRYQGNCSCEGGPASCAIPRGAFPPRPCVATWSVPLANSPDVAAALINLGENFTRVRTRIDALVPAATAAIEVTDVWTSKAVGPFPPSNWFEVSLRPHESVLLLLTAVNPPPAPPPPNVAVVGVPCNASDATQLGWTHDIGSGALTRGGLCLSTEGWDLPLHMRSCGNTSTHQNFTRTGQQFRIDAPAPVKLYPACLQVAGAIGPEPAEVDVYACGSRPQQQFAVDAGAGIISTESSECLAARG